MALHVQAQAWQFSSSSPFDYVFRQRYPCRKEKRPVSPPQFLKLPTPEKALGEAINVIITPGTCETAYFHGLAVLPLDNNLSRSVNRK